MTRRPAALAALVILLAGAEAMAAGTKSKPTFDVVEAPVAVEFCAGVDADGVVVVVVEPGWLWVVVEVDATEIVDRILGVLAQGVTSLTHMDEVAVASSGAGQRPRQFEFVRRAELRPVLEQAFADGRDALERQARAQAPQRAASPARGSAAASAWSATGISTTSRSRNRSASGPP